MDAPTAGVLRDIALLIWVVLAVGAFAYRWVRMSRPALAWNWGGNVSARGFALPDAVVVLGIGLLMTSGFAGSVEPTAPQAPRQLTFEVLVVNAAFQLILCAVLLFYLVVMRGLQPMDLFGLRRQGFLRSLGMAVAFIVPTWAVVGIVAQLVSQWLKLFWPDQTAQVLVEAFRNTTTPSVRILVIFAAVVIAPLVEEIVFRGFVYGVVKRYTDGYFAALTSALLFALIHGHVGSLVPLTVLALIFCLAYEITGTLLVPMCMHALFNAASLAALMLYEKGAGG